MDDLPSEILDLIARRVSDTDLQALAAAGMPGFAAASRRESAARTASRDALRASIIKVLRRSVATVAGALYQARRFVESIQAGRNTAASLAQRMGMATQEEAVVGRWHFWAAEGQLSKWVEVPGLRGRLLIMATQTRVVVNWYSSPGPGKRMQAKAYDGARWHDDTTSFRIQPAPHARFRNKRREFLGAKQIISAAVNAAFA